MFFQQILFIDFFVNNKYQKKMGGGNTKTVVEQVYKEVYIKDPEIENELIRSRRQIAKLTSKVGNLRDQLDGAFKKAKNMENYKDMKKSMFNDFVENINTCKFQEKIPKKDGQRHHVLIGNISAGKTSLINSVCGTNLPVGLGQTTLGVRRIAFSASSKVHIWDSPGVNEDFAFYDTEVLAYFHSADRIFILYPDSLKSCKQMIQVLYKIKPSNTYLVRTQCDRWQVGFNKSIQEQIQTDKLLLKQWNVKLPVLATSSKKPEDFMDNDALKKLLIGVNEYFNDRDDYFQDQFGWIRVLKKKGKQINPQFNGKLTQKDIGKMNILDIGWSNSDVTMATQSSYYIKKVTFKTNTKLSVNQVIANVFNGKNPDGSTSLTHQSRNNYLSYEGVVQTYRKMNPYYTGRSYGNYNLIGKDSSLRTGGRTNSYCIQKIIKENYSDRSYDYIFKNKSYQDISVVYWIRVG